MKGETRSLHRGYQRWPSFCSQTTPLCFGLIFIRGKLNPANSGGLNFRTHTHSPVRNDWMIAVPRCKIPKNLLS